ncbi:MAG: 50S ribosomal protein L10 [Mollicutes bacterium PWAP]|nr:50S ribosomal protein L10 [Mollicutes bacterium PWAP]
MNANRQLKVESVKEIQERITVSSSVVVVNYQGLTVAEFQKLRSQLSGKGVILKVYKNRLFKVAIKETDFEDLNASLTGANAFAFGSEDDIAPAKILAKFADNHEALELKSGIYEGKVIDATEVATIAALPSFEEALTMLATSLMAPLRQLSVGMNMLVEEGHIEQKPNEVNKDKVTEETLTEAVA